jgi:hypothetical protein
MIKIDVLQLIKKVQGRLWSVHSASCNLDLILYDVGTHVEETRRREHNDILYYLAQYDN